MFSHKHLNLQKPIRQIAHVLNWDLALDHKHSDYPPVPRPAHWLLSPTLEPKLNLLMQIHPRGEAWEDVEKCGVIRGEVEHTHPAGAILCQDYGDTTPSPGAWGSSHSACSLLDVTTSCSTTEGPPLIPVSPPATGTQCWACSRLVSHTAPGTQQAGEPH